MTISKDLFLSILAMDSYNQGYDAGVAHGKTRIGAATFDDDKGDAGAQAVDFYAIAYAVDTSEVDDMTEHTVISYRGTDAGTFF